MAIEVKITRKVFDYRDVEEAKKYIGKPGLFSDSLFVLLEDGGESEGILVGVDHEGYPFRTGSSVWQFFSPDPEPVEEWVPFTREDFPALLGRGVLRKSNGSGTMIGSFNTEFWLTCSDPAVGTTPARLLEEYTFIDGTPCGKKVLK